MSLHKCGKSRQLVMRSEDTALVVETAAVLSQNHLSLYVNKYYMSDLCVYMKIGGEIQ